MELSNLIVMHIVPLTWINIAFKSLVVSHVSSGIEALTMGVSHHPNLKQSRGIVRLEPLIKGKLAHNFMVSFVVLISCLSGMART